MLLRKVGVLPKMLHCLILCMMRRIQVLSNIMGVPFRFSKDQVENQICNREKDYGKNWSDHTMDRESLINLKVIIMFLPMTGKSP